MKTHRFALIPLTTLLLFGCAQQVAPIDGAPSPGTPSPGTPSPTQPIPTQPTPGSLGLVAIDFLGVGTEAQTASARNITPEGVSASSLTNVSGGLDVSRVTTGSFTVGTAGQAGAYRYVYATFKVRNADRNGVAYNVPRSNLTFLAASATSGTFGETPVAVLKRFDGSDYPTSGALTRDDLARAMVPTHGMVLDPISGTPQVLPSMADLQVLTEGDVAAYQPGGATPVAGAARIFPYGFVVRSAGSTSTRNLPANPAANQYDGRVTFAVRVPMQANAVDDPFSFTLMFNVVDDATTRVTESVEEQGASSGAATRATLLGANTKIMTLCGTTYGGANGIFVGSATTAGNTSRLNKIGGDLALKTSAGLDFSSLSTPGNTDITTPPNSAAQYEAFGGATLNTTVTNSGASALGGNVTLNPDGSLTYDPPIGQANITTDTFGVKATASGGSSGTCESPTLTAKAPVVSASRVWYVNNANAAATRTGRKSSPFNTLSAAQTASSAGDVIYVYKGSGTNTGLTDGLTLKANQKLIGQAAALVVDGKTIEPAVSGGEPSIGSNTSAGITLQADATSNRELRGFNLASGGSAANAGISGTGFGTLRVSGVGVTSAAPALNLSSGTFGDAGAAGSGSSFTSVTSTNSSGTGVSLSTLGGKVNLGTGSLSNALSGVLSVSGGSVDVTYSGNAAQSINAPVLSVSGGHTGTLTLDTGTWTATNGSGLQFDNADGTYNLASTSGTVNLSNTVGGVNANAGIDLLNGSGGTFTFGRSASPASFAVTNPSGSAFVVNGSAPSVTYHGNLTKSGASAGLLVDVTNQPSGTITFSSGTLSSTSSAGTGLNFSNADGTVNLSGTTTLSGGDAGIDVTTGSSGTFSFASGSSVTNPTNEAVRIDASNPTFTYGGSISKTNGSTGLTISNNTGGVIDFTGTTKTITATGANTAVNLATNTGATVNFTNGGLAITSATGNGLSATGGGTLSVTGSNNTISSAGGTALSVQNTTIGTNGLNFRSISANGGPNGIFLNSTGTTAGLTVSGDGATAGSGGVIQNTTGVDGATAGNGVYLNATRNVNLNWLNVSGHQNFGIFGQSVTNFSLADSVVRNNGNNVSGTGEASIGFRDLFGTASITGRRASTNATTDCRNAAGLDAYSNTHPSTTCVSGGSLHNIDVTNTSGSLDRLTVDTIDVGYTGNVGADGIFLQADGASGTTLKATVTNSYFRGAVGDQIQMSARSSSTMDFVVTNNAFTNNNPNALPQTFGVILSSGGSGGGYNPQVTYNISNNKIRDVGSTPISVGKGGVGAGNFTGTISNNTIGVAGVADSGSKQGSAIVVDIVGGGSHTSTITNNMIRQFTNYGVLAQAGNQTAGGGQGTLNVTLKGNNISEPSPASATGQFPTSGIRVVMGTNAGDSHKGCVTIGGTTAAERNTLTGSGTNGATDLRLFQRFTTILAVPGYGGVNNDNDAMNTFLTQRNTLSSVSATNNTGGGGPGYSSNCSF